MSFQPYSTTKMATVACVLRSGGLYTPAWVYALKHGLTLHMREPYQLLVLTDTPAAFGPWGLPLRHNLPGWWAKMELFRPDVWGGEVPERVLYLDLDTLVVGPLDDLWAAIRAGSDTLLAMLSDFYRPHMAESGVMAFTPGEHTAKIWERFIAAPEQNMQHFHGDGRFISDQAPWALRLQEMVPPGQIVSFKVDARAGRPADARIVCGHGRPRFNTIEAGWAHDHWRGQLP